MLFFSGYISISVYIYISVYIVIVAIIATNTFMLLKQSSGNKQKNIFILFKMVVVQWRRPKKNMNVQILDAE